MAKTKSTKNLKDVESKLRAERDELLRQISDLEGHRAGEVRADIDSDGEPENVTYERERALSLLDNARGLLDHVETALRRVDDGTYGICESCGKKIEAPRLKALPHATLCIACKRKEERH